MHLHLRSLVAALLALFALTSAALAHEQTLIVQVRSDLRVGVDFDTVRTVLIRTDVSPPVTVDTHDFAAGAHDFALGVRVYEDSLLDNDARYRINVQALLGGTVVVERPVALHTEGHFHWAWGAHASSPQLHVVTVLLTVDRAPIRATETIGLAIDADGDGTPSPGDTVEVKVRVSGDDLQLGGRFTQRLPSGATLVPGSVIASKGGTVNENQGLDGPIDVDLGPLAPGDAIDVRFAAFLEPSFVGHGRVEVRTGDQDAYVVFTDDPQTPDDQDPTELFLTCPRDDGALAQCRDELAACDATLDQTDSILRTCQLDLDALGTEVDALTDALDVCATDVAALQDALRAAIDDPDLDGIPTAWDACPATRRRAPVDAAGCSQSDFCATTAVSGSLWFVGCWVADWRQDDAALFPGDCRADGWRRRCVSP